MRRPSGKPAVYAIPSAAELPRLELLTTETPTPRGVPHLDMPCTPERVWRAIQDARSQAG